MPAQKHDPVLEAEVTATITQRPEMICRGHPQGLDKTVGCYEGEIERQQGETDMVTNKLNHAKGQLLEKKRDLEDSNSLLSKRMETLEIAKDDVSGFGDSS